MDEGKLPVPITGQVVGYGRPPAEHRFQKGRSGNPGGRPPRSKNKPKRFDPASQPTDNLILEEAYRPVTIPEGERTIQLPAIQVGDAHIYDVDLSDDDFARIQLVDWEMLPPGSYNRVLEHLASRNPADPKACSPR